MPAERSLDLVGMRERLPGTGDPSLCGSVDVCFIAFRGARCRLRLHGAARLDAIKPVKGGEPRLRHSRGALAVKGAEAAARCGDITAIPFSVLAAAGGRAATRTAQSEIFFVAKAFLAHDALLRVGWLGL